MNATPSHPLRRVNRGLSIGMNRGARWLSAHWLAAVNLFFFTYVGLPILAPVLLAAGFTGAANAIYQTYNMVCHQLPTRTYFIFGEQVAMCERCLAIYGTLFVGGLAFNFARYKALPLRWYLLFALPMALDGGSAFVSELAVVIPLWVFWLLWTIITAFTVFILIKQGTFIWQIGLVFVGGYLALAFLQFAGLRVSNWSLRTLTGAIFGVGTVWFAYPMLQESFRETWRDASVYLARVEPPGPVK